MPSRRDFLTGVAAAGFSAIAGCSGYLDRTNGTVFRKTVSVAHPTNDRGPVWVSAAILSLGGDGKSVIAQYDPEYAAVNGGAGELSVSAEQEEVMAQRFTDVEYIAGVMPGEGESGPIREAHRTDFNDMHVGGSATVGEYSTDDGGYFRLHGADSPQQPLTIKETTQFDLDDWF
ncbi:twin-arginine translocation signal domain-containing protein [Halomarina rubra]|uniref:Twin-arginine translocation signal domain-containing protein n=1 Tax=Halomarina rubra TaxID=2071873 RepID=A0ABD6AWV9_9EURY|nr:twin-arginine translocation signal domain-containing protein [Halomarina rubra]